MSDDKWADKAIPTDANVPVDLADIMRDEQFINALLGEGEVRTESAEDFELATLFSTARYAVLDSPVDFEFNDEQIFAALADGQQAARPRGRRLLTSLGAGAASVALVLGGLAIVSSQMGGAPGDSQSRQVVSASMIRADLDEAQDLLDQGEVVRGVELLNATTDRMGKLDRTAEFQELDNIRMNLWARATGQPASAAPAVGTLPTVPRDLPTLLPSGPVTVPIPSLPQIVLPPLPVLPQIPLPGLPGGQAPGGSPAPSEVPSSTPTPSPSPSSVTSTTPTPTASSTPTSTPTL